MASDSKDKRNAPPGVRGPGGPPPPPARGSGGSGGGSGKGTPPPARGGAPRSIPSKPASPLRRWFEGWSYPIVERLSRLPKFVVVVTPGILLFLGLIQTGNLAWLGGVLLLIVAALLAWLTALSWPVISIRSRIVRVVVVLVVIGFAVFKFTGKF